MEPFSSSESEGVVRLSLKAVLLLLLLRLPRDDLSLYCIIYKIFVNSSHVINGIYVQTKSVPAFCVTDDK